MIYLFHGAGMFSHSYYFFPSDCNCNKDGSIEMTCDDYGQCTCKDGYGGKKCDSCLQQFYGFPNCKGIV